MATTVLPAIRKLMDLAESQLGYIEKATNYMLDDFKANVGNGNYTKYARDLDAINFYNGKKNGYAWCDVFVDWNFVKTFGVELALKITGQEKGGLGAGCLYSANYYKKMNRFFDYPEIGDQIFFSGSGTVTHTGLVVDKDDKYVYTIEGNTSSSPGVVPNGGCVRNKKYRLDYNRIYGYGRPRYELVTMPSDVVDKVSGYIPYKKDENPDFIPYIARVECDSLNIRSKPTIASVITGIIEDRGSYTIVSESTGMGATKWGKLKSGLGWISLDYCKRVE